MLRYNDANNLQFVFKFREMFQVGLMVTKEEVYLFIDHPPTLCVVLTTSFDGGERTYKR